MTKLHMDQETLHPIPFPYKEGSKISIDPIRPLKEMNGYKYIVAVVANTIKFV